jgi:RNA polymerase primary sigma factor
MNENVPAAPTDDDVEEEAEAALTTVDAEFGRTTDPVRMYMREMGSVELLTREGEIAIAKRIEEGLNQMQAALASFPATIARIGDCGTHKTGKSACEIVVKPRYRARTVPVPVSRRGRCRGRRRRRSRR